MRIIRAPDEFLDFDNRVHKRARLSWGRLRATGDGLDRVPIAEGEECEPYQTIGSLGIGEGDAAVSAGVGVDSFGRIGKLLAPDGSEVEPGQSLMEYEERQPNMEEWAAQYRRANAAERRTRDLRHALRSPLAAFWFGAKEWWAVADLGGLVLGGLVAVAIYAGATIVFLGLIIGVGALVRTIT